ncbi:dipeptide epimerase [Lentibacillus sediminis]|uniref:dipeptide epimerase n=1 Tax=Lentibacillus sediminis TaxID=1940529 RepID=UPI000C1C75CA|nr:dipeptide epimerase [Lentibacillus sediminis]
MRIQRVETYRAAVPLHTPFKTALRTVTVAETLVVKITSEDGYIGWGEAPPTHVITGDSLASIDFAVNGIFKPLMEGASLEGRERLFEKINKSIVGNTSAKAAVDMAIYDLISQQANLSLASFLGGYTNTLETDYTVSVGEPAHMAEAAVEFADRGFTTLKIKVGKGDPAADIKRLQAIRERTGNQVKLRLDANQGWLAGEAVRTIRTMEDLGLDIELVEQPVRAGDIAGLKQVTTNTETPIMADESVFSPKDARIVLEQRAADLINIKLMKGGGIHQALKIAKLADVYGVECMVGSMIETKIGITAAAHFAASQPNVTRYDFDAPLMLTGDLAAGGGIIYKDNVIHVPDEAGLGIRSIDWKYVEKCREEVKG